MQSAMSANVPAHSLGFSSSCEREAPYDVLPGHIPELVKWCRICERYHEEDMCQLAMVNSLVDVGFEERYAVTSRVLIEGWEQRRSRNLQTLQAVRVSHIGVNGGNTGSAGQQQPQQQQQQQQQTGPTSRITEGPIEVSDSEDESDYEDESDVDGESNSDASESAPASAPEAIHSKIGKPKESEESFCLFVAFPVVFLVILCAYLVYLVAKSKLRLVLAVYDV